MSHSIGSMFGTLYRELSQIYTTGSALLSEGYKAFREIPTVQKISQTVSPVLERCKDHIPDDFKTKGFVYGFASALAPSTALSWINRTPDKTLDQAILTAEKNGLPERAKYLKGGKEING